jgi:hypothetical protein
LFLSLLGAIVLLVTIKLIVRQWLLAAVITSQLMFLFYSYGHVYMWFRGLGAVGEAIGRHRIMVPLWIILFILGTWMAVRRKDDLSTVTKMLNLFGLIAILLPLFQILIFSAKSRMFSSKLLGSKEEMVELELQLDQIPPDIYYFILDSYTRQDILLENVKYDNSEFIGQIEDLGFYVAHCSQSNYAHTYLSMAATFNMQYLQDFPGGIIVQGNESLLPSFIRHNVVRDLLEKLGYTIVAFETGYSNLHWPDADVYLSPPRSASLDDFFNIVKINDFEAMLLQSSAAWTLVDLFDMPDRLHKFVPDLNSPKEIFRNRTLYVLDQFRIDRVPAIQGPKFVYTHLILPHFPYVFGQNGEEVKEETWDYSIEAYRNQLIYTNKRMLAIVKDLIKNAPRPSIIILQGDHGFQHDPPNGRVAILNAYYFPEGGKQALYPTISPVNSFRVIFNQYFQGEYELLEDRTYFSYFREKLNFIFEIQPESNCSIPIDS